MDEELSRRRELSFLQAEGLAPLPSQMQQRKVPRRLRIALLEIINFIYQDEINERGDFDRFKTIWMFYFERFGDEFPVYWSDFEGFIKKFLETADDVNILDFAQAVARQAFISDTAFRTLRLVIERDRLAYRLVGTARSVDDKPTLIPVSALDQTGVIEENWKELSKNSARGAAEHLRRASDFLSKGQYNDAVRESIHAVESAAKVASGDSSATLTDALALLDKAHTLHPALRQALVKLYGWTSDAQGVRHALIEPTNDIPEQMALFMFSACTAFAAWLLSYSK